MIEVKNLVKKYGDRVAVDGLTFKLSDGKIHGFLGPNGAGKSTTMNVITGCLSATAGSVTINGIDISKSPAEAKKKIGYLPEIPPLYENMTPYEYLVFVGEAKKVPYEKLYRNVKSVMELTHIEDVGNRLIKNLSKGYRQRVGIAQTMLGNPDVIVLDEPMVGLDPKQIIEVRDLIKKLGQVKTILISSHILSEISEICDDIIIISHGKMIAHDTIANLEGKLNRTQALCISARGSEESVLSALDGVEGLTDCTVTGNRDGIVSLKLEHDSNTEIRDAVFAVLAAAACPILSMDTEALTLEDIFLKLTDVEETEDAEQEPKKKKTFGKEKKSK
ncbi:MAG: ABC transporter ATP-binding protein [Clostridia bacterium]|nr:ABC transporter ATP-binding protein [Clostridia bacterium]